jgi:hypothetical protein
VSTTSEIAAVLEELSRLNHADPAALARREEILATKRELVERLGAEEPAMPPPPVADPGPGTCARPGCDNPLRPQARGRPARYCSPACRPSARTSRRRGVIVELDHPEASPDGRPLRCVWSVTLRRGRRAVVIATDLGWPSAHALARQLEDLLHPVPQEGSAIE